MAYMSDRHRVEILLPPQMMLAVITAGVTDQETPEFKSLSAHLHEASAEPIRGMTHKQQRKIVERCMGIHLSITAPYRGENEEVAKVGLINFFVMKAIVESGYIQYLEGSPLDLAFQEFMMALEEHAQIERKAKSAQKQARKVLAHLQRLGYYPGVEMAQDDENGDTVGEPV